ncbi:FtsW/RodA/SpoVE family cell cycle protein [Carnobacterium funditum]|uniref:FtsW/RodA/SpoVE family cell cycle protein n=1 Tax=Carnobacterium funditum TaxID=2752 RepID=UPI00055424E1|nr:FtsW/RodA/SpoVE family cell cycle protein [Carnobacterium funditum]
MMKKLKHLDQYIFIPYVILSIFGTLMVYSSSSYVAIGQDKNPEYYFLRQAVFVCIGLFISMFIFSIKYSHLKYKKLIKYTIIFTVLLLAYLLVFGKEINGAKGWLDIGPVGVQPAEFAKISVIWYFAYIFSRRQQQIIRDFWSSMKQPAFLFAVILLLIAIQPDIGGAAIILFIGIIMIFASGVSTKLGITMGALGIAIIFGVVELVRIFGTKLPFLQPYQYDRFLAFWDPFKVSESAGLQLVNSYYALSRGGVFGVGIGQSVQKTGYLPEPYTDFIVSILGEELGLLGVIVVLSLFVFLILRIYLIAIRTKDPFGSLLCIGIATMFLIQGSINLGGVLGLMPITGVTFPFISYGGSSTLVLTISIGLVLNVSAMNKKQELGNNS